MSRTHIITLAALCAALALPAAAEADAPLPRTVSVNGGATETVAADASPAARRAAYGVALLSALDEAREKADIFARRLGFALGPIQSVYEQSDAAGQQCQPATRARARARSRSARVRPARRASVCEISASVGLTVEIR